MLLLLAVGAAYIGSSACAPCHAAVFRSYSRTAMARSSGLVSADIPEGTVRHALSSMVYRVGSRGGMAFFQYSSLTDAPLNGRQQIGEKKRAYIKKFFLLTSNVWST